MADNPSHRTLREIFAILFSKLTVIFLIVLIAGAGTALACIYSKKVYRSSVTFWARQPRSANPLAATPDPTRRLEVFLKTQREIIFSDTVLRRTLAQLNASQNGKKLTEQQLPQASKQVPQADVRQFRKRVKITTPGGQEIAQSEVFTISVDQDQPPRRAQMAASILADQYLAKYRQLRAVAEQNSQELLSEQLAHLRQSILSVAEQRFNDFINQKLKGNLIDVVQMFRGAVEVNHQSILTAFQTALIKMDASLKEHQALKKEVLAQIPPKAVQDGTEMLGPADLQGYSIIVPLKVLTGNDIVNKMKKKLADLIIRRNSLQVQFTDDFAIIRQTQQEIFKTKLAIIDELIAEAKAIDQRVNTLSARRAEIQRRVQQEEQTMTELSGLFVQYQSYSQDVDLARQLYSQKRKDLLDAETARRMAQQDILITQLEDAILPDVAKPVRPVLSLYTAVAALVGLMMGIAYAFLADFYDHSLRSTYQVQQYLSLPVLTSVRKLGRGLIVP